MSDTRAFRLTVPMPLNLANSRVHWRVKHKQRQAYFDALDWLAIAKQLPAPPTVPLDSVTLEAVMHLARQMDHDNAVARCKWPIDWLRTRGYIADDSPSHLRWASFPEQRVKRNGNYCIDLTLTASSGALTIPRRAS